MDSWIQIEAELEEMMGDDADDGDMISGWGDALMAEQAALTHKRAMASEEKRLRRVQQKRARDTALPRNPMEKISDATRPGPAPMPTFRNAEKSNSAAIARTGLLLLVAAPSFSDARMR